MKNFIILLSIGFISFLSSCEKNDINDETGIELAIDKDKVEPPGGQSSTEEKYIFKAIDKENVETPGGQR